MKKLGLLTLVLILLGVWYLSSDRNASRTGTPVLPGSKPVAPVETAQSKGTIFTPIPSLSMPPAPPGSNPKDQERLDRLRRAIREDGKPKREQAIVELQTFLQNTDPRVRLEAGEMLYEMKDRSGYATLLDLLRSPEPVPSIIGDLREVAAGIFAHYRERWPGDVLLSQYEKTRSPEIAAAILTMRLEGMAPYLHEMLQRRTSSTTIEGLAVLETLENQSRFKQIANNTEADPRQRAAAIFGLARNGDAAALDRLIAVAINPRETLPGNHEELWAAKANAARYLRDFRGERVVKVFEDMLTWKNKEFSPPGALVYLRYRYPQNQASREVVKAGLQPGGSRLGWDFTLLLRLARLSGDPELIALGRNADRITSFREFDVRAGWSNAWIGDYLPDWEGDW